MTRSFEAFESAALGRRMEFLWFGDRGYPVVMFPTSMARFYEYEDFGTVRALAAKIESGALQLVCVDSVDAESFYNES
ncbi:MAG: esterase, partial [Candidatus Eremiobacteraeota bacterium]|nr:esterase [Candidatus Eremiobacteraeota bacterium]